MSLDNVVRVTSYLTTPEDAERNAAARVRALRGRLVPTTAVVVTTLDPTWRVEVEVIAAAWCWADQSMPSRTPAAVQAVVDVRVPQTRSVPPSVR